MKRTYTENEVEGIAMLMQGYQTAEKMQEGVICKLADMLEIDDDDAEQFLKDFNTTKQLLDTIGGEVYKPVPLHERRPGGV